MHTIHTIEQMRNWREKHHSVAFVPTMGNLHEGHIALIKKAKTCAKHVVVSIFVNRLQFGQGEDFSSYPRTLKEDEQKLRIQGVDAVFIPDESVLYPNVTQDYNIEPPGLQNELCGVFRPGHFRGVATVVTKLFNIVTPDVACFGQKDYQQLTIIRGMVADLNMNIKIVAVDTGRASDGLALSSRNQYLTEQERNIAPLLYQTLCQTANALKNGERNYAQLEQKALSTLKQNGFQAQYIEIRQADTLQAARSGDCHLIILAAALLGKTRLIDNVAVNLE